jgi:hypothetical protein
MRSEKLMEGDDYALKVAGGDAVQVRLKSVDARYASKVIVVPRHGNDDTKGIEVPADRLVSTWEQYLASNMEMTNTRSFRGVLWIPKEKEVVHLEGMGDLQWTVAEVSFQNGEGWAVVRSEVFGQPQEQTVPITQIHRRASSPSLSAMELRVAFSDQGIAPLHWQSEEAPVSEPEQVEPVDNLQPHTVADRLALTDAACDAYRRLGWCKPGQEEEKMQNEVRRWGAIGVLYQPEAFVSYVVPGRFEFALEDDPRTVEDDLWVPEIIDIRSDKAKAKFARELEAVRPRRSQHRRRGKRPARGKRPEGSSRPRQRRRNRRRRPSS